MKDERPKGVPISSFPLDPTHKLAKAMSNIDWGLLQEPSELFQKEFRSIQPIRRIYGLFILESVRGLEGDSLLQQWIETPVMQYFTGENLFHWELPITNEEIQTCKGQLSSKGIEILKLMVDEVNRI